MSKINCLVKTQEIRDLIQKIKSSYPEKYGQIESSKVDDIIMSEIESESSKLGGRTPTFTEMKGFYENRQIETNFFEKEAINPNIEVLQKRDAMSFASTQEREDRVILVSRMFSNIVDDLYESAKITNPKLTRQQFIIRNLGSILNSTKEILAPQLDDDAYLQRGLQQIQDNWSILLSEVSNVLFTTEGVSLSFVDLKSQETDDYEDRIEDSDNSEDSEYSTKDGWMIKAREVDLRDTLSEKVRKLLNNIPKLDRNDDIETDDLGYDRYINADYAHIKLLDALSSIYDSSEFDTVLNSMIKKYPWVKGIIQSLDEDTDDLKALFYNDLRKEFMPYWVQIGNETKQVNKNPGIYYLFNDWRANYEAGITLDKNSIYNNRNEISIENGIIGVNICDDLKNGLVTSVDIDEYIKESLPKIKKILNMIGIDFTEEEILSTVDLSPKSNFEKIVNQCNIVFTAVQKNEVNNDEDFINKFNSVYTELATLFNTIPEGAILATFRETGKSYQSYSAVSYLGRLLNGIKGPRFNDVIEKEYKQYSQFYNPTTGYNLEWLNFLTGNKSKIFRDLLSRKIVLHKDKKSFNNWDATTHIKAQIQEFFSIPDTEGAIPAAWYAVPLLADAESAEFIRFAKYVSNEKGTVKEKIIPLLANEVLNEYNRISIVINRDKNRTSGINYTNPISNYDIIRNADGSIKNIGGAEFKFFPYLNNLELSNEIKQRYEIPQKFNFIQGLSYLLNDHSIKATPYIKDVLTPIMESSFESFYQELLPIYGEEVEEGIYKVDPIRENSTFKDDIEEYYYNSAFAYTQIVRLTTTDLAYYKNLNDFQKRYKEVYGMTLRLYTGAKYGKEIMKTIYLKDAVIKSNVYDNIKSILYNKFGKNSEKAARILEAYKDVNVADAQSYRTLESYRSVLSMVGKWTSEMEDAYTNLNNDTWTEDDFNIIWQTLKPFMFTQSGINSGVDNYGNLKVPTQIKNSEAILLALYQKVAGNINQSPILRGLNTFMNKHGIDTVNFESAIKAGGQGAINLSEKAINEEKIALGTLNTEKAVISILEKTAYPNKLENPEVVHNLNYEDYGIQVASTEHLLDHEDVLGSQFKKLIEADLSENIRLSINGKEYSKQEFHDLYQSLLTANIIDEFTKISNKFVNKDGTPNYIEVERLIQKEMAGSTRYSEEERNACKLVNRNGNIVFNLPLFDPIQSDRIQQLLFAILKKNTVKQTIKRATCIQVSSFGLTDELNIRYSNSKGEFIFNAKEWENINLVQASQRKLWNKVHKIYSSFDEYNKTEGANDSRAVAYWECYLPAYSKKFFEPLLDSNGALSIDKLPEELRKCIGMRVPTEAKYSIQPFYIKGFLPECVGSTIMVPADITTIVGSDFDVDKVLINLPEFEAVKYDNKAARYYYNKEVVAYNSLLNAITADDDSDLELNEDFKSWFEKNKERFEIPTELKKIKYDYSKPASEQSRAARNNALIDCAWAVLTNEETAPEMHQPGGFEEASRVAAICNIIKSLTSKEILRLTPEGTFEAAFKYITSLSKDEAKKLADKLVGKLNPLDPRTQVFFHQQNANGGKMIGVYAVANASHAEGQWCNLNLITPINIFNKTFQKIDNIYNQEGELISNNLSNFLAASVDNVKDPVLKALNQTPETGDKTTLLLRLGFTIQEVGLLLNAPILEKINNNYPNVELTLENIAWATYINSNIKTINLSLDEEAKYYGILNSLKEFNDRITPISEALREITDTSRGDNPNAAAGPTAGHAILKLLKISKLATDISKKDFPIKSDLLDLDNILNRDYTKLYEDSKKSNIPFLQAVTKCGTIAPIDIMSKFFPQLTPGILNLLLNKEYGLSKYIDLVGSAQKIGEDKVIKLINKFFNQFYLYALSGTNFFGKNGVSDSAKINYAQYTTKFPYYFKDIKNKYKAELQGNQFVSQLIVNEVNMYNALPSISFVNTGNLSKKQKAKITKDWEMLINSSNPEIQKLGYQLFKYAQMYGLTYTGPRSFIQLAPDTLRSSIPDYLDCLESLMSSNKDSQYNSNYYDFIEQFIRNNSDLGFFREVDKSVILGTEDNLVELPIEYSKYNFISIFNESTKQINRYKINSINEDKNTCSFIPITLLGSYSGIKEYYFGKSQVDTAISQEIPVRKLGSYDSSEEDAGISTDDAYIQNGYQIIREDSTPGIEYEFIGEFRDANNNKICK